MEKKEVSKTRYDNCGYLIGILCGSCELADKEVDEAAILPLSVIASEWENIK